MPRTWDGSPARGIGLVDTGGTRNGRPCAILTHSLAATPANGLPIKSVHPGQPIRFAPSWPGNAGTDPPVDRL